MAQGVNRSERLAQSLNTGELGEAEGERCRFRPLTGGGLRMVLRLTMRCDLACPHCLAAQEGDSDELTTDQWLTLIEQFPAIGVKKVLLTGGEPLLRHDLVTIVQAISHFGIKTDLNSNLQKMSPQLMKELKQVGLSEISISLEGPAAIHDRMHGRDGAYSQLTEAIAWANTLAIPVDASCCLTAENHTHLVELIHTAQELSIRSLTFSRLLPVGHGHHSHQALTQSQLDSCSATIRSQIDSGCPLPIRVTGLFGAPEQKDCGRGDSLVGITPDGRLLGCVLTEDNPDIPATLEIGLPQAFEILREDLAKRPHALCWEEVV